MLVKINSSKPLIACLFKSVYCKNGKIGLRSIVVTKLMKKKRALNTDRLQVDFGEGTAKGNISFLWKRGIPFLKGWRLNVCKIEYDLDDAILFDIQNRIRIVYSGDCYGRLVYNLFDFRKGRYRNTRVIKYKGMSIYFRQSVKNSVYLTVRGTNKYDNFSNKVRVVLAYICSKFVRKDIIFMFEKECSRYEESASVLYESLIDKGYKNIVYILNRDNTALKCISDRYKKYIVYKDSFKHLVYFFASKKFIGTETMGHAMQLRAASRLIVSKVSNKRIQYVFLQHGVMYMVSLDADARAGFRSQGLDLYRVVVSSELEAQHFIDLGGFTEEELYITGLAKFDKSVRNDNADKIVIMPTWRRWESNQAKLDFTNTNYYNMMVGLYNSIPGRLKDKVIILPHPLMRDAMLNSDCELNKYIVFDKSYNEILQDCEVLITDYSSISYDAFYRGSKVVFYWGEKDECLYHYGGEAHLMLDDSSAFGDVCYDFTSVGSSVENMYGAEQSSEYVNKYRNIVKYNDNRNCDRIIEALKRDGILNG